MLLLNILLSLAWAALTGRFEPVNLVFGYVLGYAILWLASRHLPSQTYFLKLPRVLEFIGFFLKELAIANFRMAVTVLSPRMKLRPAVVAVPLDLKTDTGLSLLANLITLTPGTLSLDISTDRKMLYVHTIWLEDSVEKFREDIKQGFERRVREVFEE